MIENLRKFQKDKSLFLTKRHSKLARETIKQEELTLQSTAIEQIFQVQQAQAVCKIVQAIGNLWRPEKKQGLQKIRSFAQRDKTAHQDQTKYPNVVKIEEKLLACKVLSEGLHKTFTNHTQKSNRILFSLLERMKKREIKLSKFVKFHAFMSYNQAFQNIYNQKGNNNVYPMEVCDISEIHANFSQISELQISSFKQDANFTVIKDQNDISMTKQNPKKVNFEQTQFNEPKAEQYSSFQEQKLQRQVEKLKKQENQLKEQYQTLLKKMQSLEIAKNQNNECQNNSEEQSVNELLCQKYIQKVFELERVLEEGTQIFKEIELQGILMEELQKLFSGCGNESIISI